MGRFHRHDDTGHGHDHDAQDHLGDHTGYRTGTERVEVLERVFDENDHMAAANRAEFDSAHITAINLMSSPGAGKTSVLRETLRRLQGELRVGIVEGDIETSIDADRLKGFGAAITLVNTANGFGGECHLAYSITEGEEKPLKYPVMFRSADLVLVNKVDLLPHLDFNITTFYANLRAVNPDVSVIETSARTGQGIGEWRAWLTTMHGNRLRENAASA